MTGFPSPPIIVEPGDAVPDDVELAPAVTVLVGDPGVETAVADRFDVCLTDAGGPPAPWVNGTSDRVVAAVRANPLASLALVALLRSAGRDIWSGLAAESATYAMLLGSAEFGQWLEARGPGRSDPSPCVRVEREGDVLSVVLDRPGVHNAFNRAMRDGLVEALAVAAIDPTITAVELSGAGPSFCSGGDLLEFGMVGDPATAHAVRLSRHPAWALHAVHRRAVARVHGACIGAGAELPAFAARVVASSSAYFALPEVGMGLIPGAGGTVSVRRRIGRQRCAWMALTGDRVSSSTALAWGLIDEVVD